MGTTGGGVFKTNDGGESWFPTTDGYFGGTIGAIAVAPSNPDIVYVGGGEYAIRGNMSYGDGVWKSTDGGKTWNDVGLDDTRQIEKVIVDPTNPDIVYVGAFGHVFGPNAQRGVFKTTDGGATWKKILLPQRLHRRRRTWSWIPPTPTPSTPASGRRTGCRGRSRRADRGARSTRPPTAASTGRRSRTIPGLPSGIWGNSGLAISPANPDIVWALIEAKDGGLYKSSDAGATWQLRERRQRDQAARLVLHEDHRRSAGHADGLHQQRLVPEVHGRRQDVPARSAGGHGDSHHLWIAPGRSQAHDRDRRRRRTRHHGRRQDLDGRGLRHRAVLPRHHHQRLSVQGVRRPAGLGHAVR